MQLSSQMLLPEGFSRILLRGKTQDVLLSKTVVLKYVFIRYMYGFIWAILSCPILSVTIYFFLIQFCNLYLLFKMSEISFLWFPFSPIFSFCSYVFQLDYKNFTMDQLLIVISQPGCSYFTCMENVCNCFLLTFYL